MNCDKFEEYISLRIDGRLDAAGERLLQEHLTKCPRCREALAALETAEGTAKTAPAKEPRAGYWDTFSGRVMRKIETEEAHREEVWWKRWMPVTLPPPGKRMRFAAGVASIAFAVVVGALFVSRQGDRAVPNVGQIERGREVPAEVETPAEKGKDMLAEGQTMAREEDASRVEKLVEKKVTPPPAAKTHAAPVTDKAEDASAAGKADATPPPANRQEAAEPAPTQVAEVVKEEAPQEKRPAAAENETLDVASSAEAAKEEKPAAPAPEKTAQSRAMSVSAADKRGSVATLHGPQPAGGVGLRRISDTDTALTVEGLRAHIAAWRTRIEAAPADSLREAGYREVSNACCLLASQTGDQADVDEGVRLIHSYLKSSKDPATREYLAAKLQEIQALPKK